MKIEFVLPELQTVNHVIVSGLSLDNKSGHSFIKLNEYLLPFPSAAFETKLIHPQQERLLVQTPEELSFTCLILSR